MGHVIASGGGTAIGVVVVIVFVLVVAGIAINSIQKTTQKMKGRDRCVACKKRLKWDSKASRYAPVCWHCGAGQPASTTKNKGLTLAEKKGAKNNGLPCHGVFGRWFWGEKILEVAGEPLLKRKPGLRTIRYTCSSERQRDAIIRGWVERDGMTLLSQDGLNLVLRPKR
jgi:hypothetical protein